MISLHVDNSTGDSTWDQSRRQLITLRDSMAEYKACVVCTLFILLHLVFIAVYGDHDTNTDHHEIHACYAQLLFPRCHDGTKMAILALKYGVKTPSDICQPKTTTRVDQNMSCCSYEPGDCLVPMGQYTDIHRYYAAFSGYTQPLSQPMAEWRRIVEGDNCTVSRVFSNFVSMEYQCIADTATINMASVDSRSGHFVSTIYPIIGGEDAREDNLCTITSGQPGLVIYALDIRLECYTGYENGTCIGNHSLTFMDGKQTKTFVSEVDTVLGQYHVLFSTQESSMMFLFRRDNGSRPQMVWFGVQSAEDSATVTVSCNEPEVTTPVGVTGVSGQSTWGQSTGNTTTPTANNDEADHLTIIIAGAAGGGVFVSLVIAIVVWRWRRNRSDKVKEDGFAAYRRKINEQNLDKQTRQVRPNQAKPERQQRAKQEQNESQQGKTDQQRRRKFNKNVPKGLEMSMNDPVYHDVTIPNRGPRRTRADGNKH